MRLISLISRFCQSIFAYKFLTAKLFKQGYRYHKLRKAFTQLNRIHYELIEKYHVNPEKLLQQGISNPEFYGNLVYKFKKIIGNPNFSDLFERIVNRFKKVRSNLDIMRQTLCIVFIPIMVESWLHSLAARRWFRP